MCGFVGPVENPWSINSATAKNVVHGIHAAIKDGVALSPTGVT